MPGTASPVREAKGTTTAHNDRRRGSRPVPCGSRAWSRQLFCVFLCFFLLIAGGALMTIVLTL